MASPAGSAARSADVKQPRRGIAAKGLGHSLTRSAAARPSEASRARSRSNKPSFWCLRSALRGRQLRPGDLTLKVSSSGLPPAEALQLRSAWHAAAGKSVGGPAWSARSGLLSYQFTKVSCSSGTLQVFALLPTLMPNPSLKRSANGRPPGPVWRYAVHFRQPGPGALPSSPA